MLFLKCDCCGREKDEDEMEEFLGYYFCYECWNDKELREFILKKVIK